VLGVFERRGTSRETAQANPTRPGRHDAIVFGHGRFGAAIGARLRAAGWRTLCVDFNPAEARRAREAGFDAVFGDASDPAFVGHLPLAGVRWVVATMPAHAGGVSHDDPRVALMNALAEACYRGATAAVARGVADREPLLAAGVDAVLDPFENAADRAAEIMLTDPLAEAAPPYPPALASSSHATASTVAAPMNPPTIPASSGLGGGGGGVTSASASARITNFSAIPGRRGV
jgi:hypothetical protein